MSFLHLVIMYVTTVLIAMIRMYIMKIQDAKGVTAQLRTHGFATGANEDHVASSVVFGTLHCEATL